MARTDADRGWHYYPAFLDLLRRRVVVVGGGVIAEGKVRGLLPCGPASLVLVAPSVTPFLRQQASAGSVEWLARPYRDGDLAGADLAVAATDDRALNARVAREARSRGVPVLAVDDVPHCDLIAPAVVRRGDLTVAISTNGLSPALARLTREVLERALPPYWGRLLDVAATARERLGPARARVPAVRWQRALRGEVERRVAEGATEAALELLLAKLLDPDPAPDGAVEPCDLPATSGLVSLVGAGPGDPELLTLRALRRLELADAVVHDRLIGPGILERARPGARLVDVGKTPGGHGWRQEAITRLLIDLAREGLRVVRLKGGDPFVFGRGGEEALALAAAGVPFEVVPGVSSALAAPAAAGIPVTHRELASSVTIVAGHAAAGGDPRQDWAALARCGGTLVFLMAVAHLESIVERLLASGRPPDEAAAVVRWGATPEQQVVRGPLSRIAPLARAAQIRPPAVLVVGRAVELGDRLGGLRGPAATYPTLAAVPVAVGRAE